MWDSGRSHSPIHLNQPSFMDARFDIKHNCSNQKSYKVRSSWRKYRQISVFFVKLYMWTWPKNHDKHKRKIIKI